MTLSRGGALTSHCLGHLLHQMAVPARPPSTGMSAHCRCSQVPSAAWSGSTGETSKSRSLDRKTPIDTHAWIQDMAPGTCKRGETLRVWGGGRMMTRDQRISLPNSTLADKFAPAQCHSTTSSWPLASSPSPPQRSTAVSSSPGSSLGESDFGVFESVIKGLQNTSVRLLLSNNTARLSWMRLDQAPKVSRSARGWARHRRCLRRAISSSISSSSCPCLPAAPGAD